MKYTTYLLAFLFSHLLMANDGSYFASGNQLIPIFETDISVKKEILTIKKVNNKQIEVTVYYEFYNPKEAKKITVGFEAFAPSGDVDGAPINGKHPYMRDFTVILNNATLPYKVAYVDDSLYAQSGKVKSLNLNTFDGSTEGNDIDFYYVYHFEATFKKGLNIIQHTYTYDVSGGIDVNYYFNYILTAANRWGNNQIDDFTLILDMGEFETFTIDKSFFNNIDEWTIDGVGKAENIIGEEGSLTPNDGVKFHIRTGTVTFKKMNFKPAGEIAIYTLNYYPYFDGNEVGYLPFSNYQPLSYIDFEIQEGLILSTLQKKVLKNLPFARRGYIFQSTDLKNYFENLDWYMPDPSYLPVVENLTSEEKEWIQKWK